jgi:hypothetical protein
MLEQLTSLLFVLIISQLSFHPTGRRFIQGLLDDLIIPL